VHKGAVDPCKIDAAGAIPALSTISFPSSHLGEGARLLTGVARFETVDGSQFTFDADVFLPKWKHPPFGRLKPLRISFALSVHLSVAQLDE
jgi:hypothetical protein